MYCYPTNRPRTALGTSWNQLRPSWYYRLSEIEMSNIITIVSLSLSKKKKTPHPYNHDIYHFELVTGVWIGFNRCIIERRLGFRRLVVGHGFLGQTWKAIETRRWTILFCFVNNRYKICCTTTVYLWSATLWPLLKANSNCSLALQRNPRTCTGTDSAFRAE